MTIQYASDLHLEFEHNKRFITENPLKPKGDVLLLAGDIVQFAHMEDHNDFWDYISKHFPLTYWIPGNHEYYGYELTNKYGTFKESIRENVFLVNNHTEKIGDISIIFSTLWSSIHPQREYVFQRDFNDFKVIKYNNRPLRVEDYNALHAESLLFLTEALRANRDQKSIAVTHHVPTFTHYPPKYLGDVLNQGFATELYKLMLEEEPNYWIYGHHHHNTPAFEIGKTKLLTNQLGYLLFREIKDFDGGKCFEL
jgi:predicted phosphohydrolase